MENDATITNEQNRPWIDTHDLRDYLIENNMWDKFNYDDNMDGSTTILSHVDEENDGEQYGCLHLTFATSDEVGDYGIFEVSTQMTFKNAYNEYVHPIETFAMPKAFKYKLDRQCAHLLIYIEAVLLPKLTYLYQMRNFYDEVATTTFKPNYNYLSIEYSGSKGIIELDEIMDVTVHGYGYGEAMAKFTDPINFPNHNFYILVSVIRDGDSWVIEKPLKEVLDVEVV